VDVVHARISDALVHRETFDVNFNNKACLLNVIGLIVLNFL